MSGNEVVFSDRSLCVAQPHDASFAACQSVGIAAALLPKVPLDVLRNRWAFLKGEAVFPGMGHFSMALLRQTRASLTRSGLLGLKNFIAQSVPNPEEPWQRAAALCALALPCKFFENATSIHAVRASLGLEAFPSNAVGLRRLGLLPLTLTSAIGTTCSLVLTGVMREKVYRVFPHVSEERAKQVASLSVGIFSTLLTKPLDTLRMSQIKAAQLCDGRVCCSSTLEVFRMFLVQPNVLRSLMPRPVCDMLLTSLAFYLVLTGKDVATRAVVEDGWGGHLVQPTAAKN